jgi:hypothetical protein
MQGKPFGFGYSAENSNGWWGFGFRLNEESGELVIDKRRGVRPRVFYLELILEGWRYIIQLVNVDW